MANGQTVQSFTRFVPPHPSFAAIAVQLAGEYSRGQGVTPMLRRIASIVRLIP